MATEDTYEFEKVVAIFITLALAAICGGLFIPAYARFTERRLRGRLRKASDADRKRLEQRIAVAHRRGQSPAAALLLGADGRLSTSRTIAVLWTVIVAYVLIALLFLVATEWDDALTNLWPTYALLLGGPYAAYVLAQAAVSVKVRRGTLQKPAGDGSVRLGDLVADDSGSTDVTDVQFVIFNVIAMGFVVLAFWRATVDGFPEIPEGLLLLTGGPAAVYLANKTVASNQPVLFSAFPTAVRPGQEFTVHGQNLRPEGEDPPADATAGATAAPGAGTAPNEASPTPGPKVEVGGVEATDVRATSTTILAKAPAAAAAATPHAISVITTAGLRATLPSALLIVTKPVLIALNKPSAAPGEHVTATGTWPANPDIAIHVLVDGITADVVSQPAPGQSLTFAVPPIAPTPPRTVKVNVVAAGETSDDKTLEIT